MVRNEQLLGRLHHIMHPDVAKELTEVFQDLLDQKYDQLGNVDLAETSLRALMGEIKLLKQLKSLPESLRNSKDRVKSGR